MKKFVVTLAAATMIGSMGQTQDVPDYLHEIETHFVNPCLKIAAGQSGVPVSDEFIEMIKTDQPQFAPLVTLFTTSDGRVVEIARFDSEFEAHQELTWAVNRYLEMIAESKS